MVSNFDANALYSLIKDLYVIGGIRISVLNDKYEVVTEYPKTAPDLCTLIRTTKKGKDACFLCDSLACERAGKLKKPHIYVCHAGVTEAISPILVDGNIIGYTILAHMLPEENKTAAIEEIKKRCKNYGLSESDIENCAKNLRSYSSEKITASIKLLDVITSYLWVKRLVDVKSDDIGAKIGKFIDGNLDEALSTKLLCHLFFVSRTKLYQISIKSFGMGIGQYITSRRIVKAKKLLESGESVYKVAKLVGISDYNYFCKVFKKHTGVSPGSLRPKNIDKH